MTERETRFARAVGRRIQILRMTRGLTQTQLGAAIGFERWQISRYERGHASISGLTVVRLAEVLEVSTDELLGVRPIQPRRGLKEQRKE
ncbi:MAG TPA: helix-turn-helix transcriptional regulator [Thermoanaerobaculia bacterium]|nr:helix-turn-helix transcriptional regulator [Thermoanaerobaculia bacterium]